MAYRMQHLTGRVFSRLTVLAEFELRGRKRVYWRCACTCGAEKWVLRDALVSGDTKSCGCLNDEARRAVAHGHTRGKQSPEYVCWHSMKPRCLNPENDSYDRYGGRGITVCDRWANSFTDFLADMGPRPPGTSIERQDNSRGYEPGNCVWATVAQQNRNHRRNRNITFQGRTLCVADWCAETGIPHATMHYRLSKWSVERALTTPPSNLKKA